MLIVRRRGAVERPWKQGIMAAQVVEAAHGAGVGARCLP